MQVTQNLLQLVFSAILMHMQPQTMKKQSQTVCKHVGVAMFQGNLIYGCRNLKVI